MDELCKRYQVICKGDFYFTNSREKVIKLFRDGIALSVQEGGVEEIYHDSGTIEIVRVNDRDVTEEFAPKISLGRTFY